MLRQRFASDKWRVTSIMNQQFLMAAMILWPLLHNGRSMEREGEIRRALQCVRAVWTGDPLRSKQHELQTL